MTIHGEMVFIDHGTGVVIGETAVIGNRVRIYQAVTLGARHFPTDKDGTAIKGNSRHPIVEDDVVICGRNDPGTDCGRARFDHRRNVWLTEDVPPNSFVTQATVRSKISSV